jgi:hypothetical protein
MLGWLIEELIIWRRALRYLYTYLGRNRRGRDHMIVLQLLMQSVPITTDVVGSTPAHGEVYIIMW